MNRHHAIKKPYFRFFKRKASLFCKTIYNILIYSEMNVRHAYRSILLLLFPMLLTLAPTVSQAQVKQQLPIKLHWQGVVEERLLTDTLLIIALDDAVYNGPMPVLVKSVPVYDDAVKVEVKLDNVTTAPLTAEELNVAKGFSCSPDFEVNAIPMRSRDEALLSITIVPFRQKGNAVEKLLSANLSLKLSPDLAKQPRAHSYAQRSAMASGNWYKVGLPSTGIYKLTYDELKALGVNVDGINPKEIRIYHNGGGVLPEKNAESRHDDLVEIPIYVSGETDGRFDKADYILFYGRGPVCWTYNAEQSAYEHVQNPYDDYAYAFVVTGLGNGKRIAEAPAITAVTDTQVTGFLDYRVHESDETNLNKTGRAYYGDKMEGNANKNFGFEFPSIDKLRPCKVKTALAGRNFSSATFNVLVDNVQKATYYVDVTNATSTNYAYEAGGWVSATPKSSTVSVTIRHNATSSATSIGYVDYIAINAWRNLSFAGSQMSFRNPDAYVINKVYEYRLANASQQVQVWNVTDPVQPTIVKGQLAGSVYTFKVNGNVNNEFVAFNGSSFLTTKAFGKVENQNLHGIRDVDFVILTYDGFMSQAQRLKDFHAVNDPDLNVLVTTPELVYNEFSCGAKDITAIRDFCRMLYWDSSRRLKYLLLLGDCSYDYKNRNEIVDFVPTYETEKSLQMVETFVTDDYFGFMDDYEGGIETSIADIGIGRFVVQTEEQASQMIDKIERYVERNANTMNPWRNVVSFFTDDEAGFVRSAEDILSSLKDVGGEDVVVDKIYLDAYNQINSPGGQIAPDVNAAINSRMEKGTLVLNYVGHGGEVQLAEEKIMQRKDVDAWRNGPMYPLMITGTCEFSRYDDHMRTSLGEYAFLNPYGGMIAMFTTSRVTYGDQNKAFIKGIYNNLFRIVGEEHNRLGDVYRMAKTSGYAFEKRYVFFGDPALRLNYPKWKVETLSINGNAPSYTLDSVPLTDTTWQYFKIFNDTIGALQPVEIDGVVKDFRGNVATDFNGVVHVTVYDKEADLSTLGSSDANNNVYQFKLRNSVIFNGKTDVKNGRFTMNFIVPRDIAYRYGQGLISYYATDYEIDANGSCDSFIIGGFYDDAMADSEAPDIRLFIDDTLFVSGGLTGENPTLLAFVADESGINTTGAGIGHDIMATLSGPSKNSYCLNDYFVSEVDDPGKGLITYKMQDLADGDYTLTLKVWDIYNNSSTATIDFTVVHSDGMIADHPANWPNPVTDETFFTFDHNQVGNNMKVEIQIFDLMGRWVTTMTETMQGNSTRVAPIRWNGRSASGATLRNGIYVYRIIATNDKGETATLVSKLVLSK